MKYTIKSNDKKTIVKTDKTKSVQTKDGIALKAPKIVYKYNPNLGQKEKAYWNR